MLIHEAMTQQIIAAAIEVHRELGPGLLEGLYEECLCHELTLGGLSWRRQVALPVMYKQKQLQTEYRLDLVVEEKVILELKAVEKLLPIHHAQIMTYLKLTGFRVGLLMNFNVPVMKDGIVRRVL
ncbi:GxxExxY protein [bacterium]|nr:GxxExxY protein [bacterium]